MQLPAETGVSTDVMNSRERQPLWDLLGHTPPVRASEGFCDQVALKARSIRQHRGSPILSLTAAAAAVLVVGIGAAIFLLPSEPRLADMTLPASESEAATGHAEEFEKIVLMDELLAVNDPAQLDDEAFDRLLFR